MIRTMPARILWVDDESPFVERNRHLLRDAEVRYAPDGSIDRSYALPVETGTCIGFGGDHIHRGHRIGCVQHCAGPKSAAIHMQRFVQGRWRRVAGESERPGEDA